VVEDFGVGIFEGGDGRLGVGQGVVERMAGRDVGLGVVWGHGGISGRYLRIVEPDAVGHI
jgi:hypothetical protein